ncbi:hypothetical protein ACF1BQ_015350 [Bradyrhizobium sp. RDT10]
MDGQTIRLEGNIGSRTVGGSGIINHCAGPECTGVCIEAPFSGQFSSVKALFPMLGAAVLACELAGLPRSAIDLSRLNRHATGKGNARKPEMRAPAKRGGVSKTIS